MKTPQIQVKIYTRRQTQFVVSLADRQSILLVQYLVLHTGHLLNVNLKLNHEESLNSLLKANSQGHQK